ncbi:hypothetical protein [Amycolatopsis sp. H20-H5]|uniref:hypothetical protein n=1 Tax=Amycolatopsis sp. H20-H5 TaxID=3046309 RepID=UPI002DBD9309|nr:hypothetical protein [Amycolatopsis sp. H20-H5]MEC3982859.1 hypothetical protein [Amycolatopsis sp. H20-H5]
MCASLLVFAAASARSIATAARRGLGHWSSLRLVVTLLTIAGFELYAGIALVADEGDLQAIRTLDYVVIADLAFGIGRAWQLMHMRDTSFLLLTAHAGPR